MVIKHDAVLPYWSTDKITIFCYPFLTRDGFDEKYIDVEIRRGDQKIQLEGTIDDVINSVKEKTKPFVDEKTFSDIENFIRQFYTLMKK